MRHTPSNVGEHRARKRFGQNFLIDQNIIQNIVASIAAKPDDNLIEIGPGQGAITALLLEHCSSLKVIEIDRDLVSRMRDQFSDSYPDLTIFEGDALKTDFNQFISPTSPLRIVGNLPYNITTPLLFHLLNYHQDIADMHFMLQKEVVDRLAAQPNTKAYGRLSVMTQYMCEVQPLFPVPASAFRPAPKVESAIVRLLPYNSPPHLAKDTKQLTSLVRACFQQRRKTIRNTLKNLVDGERLALIDFDLSLRPENLHVADFVNLSNQMADTDA